MDIVGLLAASSIPELAEAIRLKEVSPDATCWSFHGLSATYKIQTHTPLLILNLTSKRAGRRVRSQNLSHRDLPRAPIP
jgi:hypothetical protein